MSIHVSKRALSSQPIPNKNIPADQQIPPSLTSNLFRDDIYLNQLRNDAKTELLSEKIENSVSEAIKKVKTALNTIDQYADIPDRIYNIPNGVLDASDGKYDESLREAVRHFQEVFEVNTENLGFVDAVTLDKIDAFIDPTVVIDTITNQLLGKVEDKVVELVTTKENGEYSFQLIVNGETFDFRSKEPLRVKPILDKDGNFSNCVLPQNRDLLNDPRNPANIEENIQRSTLSQSMAEPYFINGDNLTIAGNNQIPDTNSIKEETGRTPPTYLPDTMTERYKVKDGDQLVDIIVGKYYSEGTAITNPFNEDGEVIFNLPKRELSNDLSTRPFDARLQFYMNLVYYYNSPVDEDSGEIMDYGIRKSTSYQRHNNGDLNDFNIFDNTFDPTIGESGLPNYYRFLQYQKEKGSSIQFDENGQTTSFEMVPDNYIWLPDVKFAEALYYNLNFRPDEMLDLSPSGIISYVTEIDFQAVITQMIDTAIDFIRDTITEAIDFLTGEIRDLMKETLEFFKAAYNFAVDFVAKNFARGRGVRLGANIGVTWGYPIATDIKVANTLWRKMSPIEELIFVMQGEFEAFVGLDTGVGYSFGFSLGSGKKKKVAGAQLGAGIRAGVKPNMKMEYELPIRREENGLLTMLITVFGSDFKEANNAAEDIPKLLSAININPLNYLTKMKYGFPFEVETWAAAEIGISSTGEAIKERNINKPKPKPSSGVTPKIPAKDGLDAESIWDKIPGMGLSANGLLSLGREMEYKAKFDNNPMVHAVDGRVPSETEMQTQYVISNTITVSAIGGFLQRMLMSFTVLPFFNLLNLLNFGFGLGYNAKYIREGKAKDMTNEGVDYSGSDFSDPTADTSSLIINKKENKLQFGDEQGKWETVIFLSKFSGDAEALFTLGSEVQLKFDLHQIRELLLSKEESEPLLSFHTIDNIFQIIYSIEVQNKMGLGYNATTRRKFTDKIGESVQKLEDNKAKGKNRVTGKKSDFLGKAKSGGLDVFFGAHLKMEFKIQNLQNVIKYYVKRWFKMLTENDTWTSTDTRTGEKAILDEAFENTKLIISTDTVTSEKEKLIRLYDHMLDSITNGISNKKGKVLLTGVPDHLADSSSGFDFKDAFVELLSIPHYMLYMLANPGQPIRFINGNASRLARLYDDLKIEELFKAINVLTEIVNVTAIIEAKGGIVFGVDPQISSGAKVRLAIGIDVGLVNILKLIDESEFYNLSEDDPYKPIYDEVKDNLNIESASPESVRYALSKIFSD